MGEFLGRALVRYLEGRVRRYEPFGVTPPAVLQQVLQPGDVLLVEGNQRISQAIKYLTQSTWSHAALYVADALPLLAREGIHHQLIEADLAHGVVVVPLEKYATFNTRVCRPVNLDAADRQRLVRFVTERIGMRYDLKNVIDLIRYLLPTPPVPTRWRRRMLALGSGDPTRAICSTLLAQAFQSIGYPILPEVEQVPAARGMPDYLRREILHIRHYSLFTPRDFDVSPYFRIIKPTIESGFDYRRLRWAEEDGAPEIRSGR